MAFTVPGTYAVGEQPPASKLNTIVTAITELQTAATTAWHAGTSIASGYAAGTPGPQVRLTPSGLQLQGEVYKSTGNVPVSTVTTLFTLPAGYRPSVNRKPVTINDNANSGRTYLYVNADGTVQVWTQGTITRVYLDGVLVPE